MQIKKHVLSSFLLLLVCINAHPGLMAQSLKAADMMRLVSSIKAPIKYDNVESLKLIQQLTLPPFDDFIVHKIIELTDTNSRTQQLNRTVFFLAGVKSKDSIVISISCRYLNEKLPKSLEVHWGFYTRNFATYQSLIQEIFSDKDYKFNNYYQGKYFFYTKTGIRIDMMQHAYNTKKTVTNGIMRKETKLDHDQVFTIDILNRTSF